MGKICGIALPLLSVILFGCATHTSETESARKSWAVGNALQAEAQLSEIALEKADSGDELVWLLEEGAASRAGGNLKKSVDVFNKAYSIICEYENEPETRLSEEAAAFFTNQSYIPYKGYHYDKIMLCVYQSLNYIELKDFEKASVELKRMSNFQAEAASKNAERIEKREAAFRDAQKKDKNAGYDASKTLSNPFVQAELQKCYGANFMSGNSFQRARGIYVNPFGYWLGGVYFAATAQDASDKEQAASLFRICSDMLANSSDVLARDCLASEAFASGKSQEFGNITYVVYETGMAPIRKQIRIDLPLFIVAKNVPHVAVNFPYLSKQNSYKSDINVVAAGSKLKFDTISNIDEIIQEEFDIELPYVITKTVLSAAAKATAQYFAAQSAGDFGVLVNIGMGIYQSLMNDADLRTWTTLPKEIKVARIETPSDSKLLLEGKSIDLNPKGVNIVYVKSMSASGAIIVRKFDFSKEAFKPAHLIAEKDGGGSK